MGAVIMVMAPHFKLYIEKEGENDFYRKKF